MKKLLCLLAFGLANAFSLPASAATLAIGSAPYIPPTDRSERDRDATPSLPRIMPVAWVLSAFNRAPPANAIIGGHESGQHGRLLAVCRVIFKNDLQVGKLVGRKCHFAYGGKEMEAIAYQVLVDIPAALTPIPVTAEWMALQAGYEVLVGQGNKNPKLMRWITTQPGQVYLGSSFHVASSFDLPLRPDPAICQAAHTGGMHVGKVVGGNCSFGYGGLEVLSNKFAELVIAPGTP